MDKILKTNQIGTLSLDEIRFFNLARYALLAALKLMNISSGDRVLVPEFICRDLLAAIHAINAVPVFYPVNEALLPAEHNQKWPKARAVIAVNYFGFPQDLTEFRDYCSRNNAFLIEDNAHGFLSSDTQNNLLGTRGDVGLFSFRKTILTPNGAALLINSSDLLADIPGQSPFLQHIIGLPFRVKLLLSSLQKKLGLPVQSWIRNLVRCLRFLQTGHGIRPLSAVNEYQLPDEEYTHQYLLKALSKLDKENEKKRRRNLFIKFEDVLSICNIHPVFNSLPLGIVPYGYPFYASGDQLRKVKKIANRAGFDCMPWPDLPAAIETSTRAHYRSLWMVNFIC